MTRGDDPIQRGLDTALREGSVGRLREAFALHIAASSVDSAWEPRDEMVSLAPFIDCARRIGVDPAATLAPIAATGSEEVRELFEMFVARTDVTLQAFGWSLVDTPSGPSYVWDVRPIRPR